MAKSKRAGALVAGTLVGSIKGGVYENFVAMVLQRNGHALRYYRNGENEVEFLVEAAEGVVP